MYNSNIKQELSEEKARPIYLLFEVVNTDNTMLITFLLAILYFFINNKKTQVFKGFAPHKMHVNKMLFDEVKTNYEIIVIKYIFLYLY
jgi:hypothetical protein